MSQFIIFKINDNDETENKRKIHCNNNLHSIQICNNKMK